MTSDQENRNYYDILHVQQSAPLAIIKNAYRALMLSMKQHPDLGGDSAQAALINEAYEVLSDDGRRTAYDRLLAADESLDSHDSKADETEPSEPGAYSTQPPFSQNGIQCAFCLTQYNALSGAVFDCGRCGSPMEPPALDLAKENSERAFERISKETDIQVLAAVGATPIAGKLYDLSPKGLGFIVNVDFPSRRVIKIGCPLFDGTAAIAHKRQLSAESFYYGAEFLTLRLNSHSGTFISTRL